jgi:hypothetical protein
MESDYKYNEDKIMSVKDEHETGQHKNVTKQKSKTSNKQINELGTTNSI